MVEGNGAVDDGEDVLEEGLVGWGGAESLVVVYSGPICVVLTSDLWVIRRIRARIVDERVAMFKKTRTLMVNMTAENRVLLRALVHGKKGQSLGRKGVIEIHKIDLPHPKRQFV